MLAFYSPFFRSLSFCSWYVPIYDDIVNEKRALNIYISYVHMKKNHYVGLLHIRHGTFNEHTCWGGRWLKIGSYIAFIRSKQSSGTSSHVWIERRIWSKMSTNAILNSENNFNYNHAKNGVDNVIVAEQMHGVWVCNFQLRRFINKDDKSFELYGTVSW